MHTKTVEYTENGTKYHITATYGMKHLQGNELTHFGITGDIQEQRGNGRWVDGCGGCIHTEIAEHFPELRHLINWHLTDSRGVPMHYIANGQYWFDKIDKPKDHDYEPEAKGAFQHTVVFGAVEGDEMPTENVTEWMTNRQEALAAAFHTDMKGLENG